MDTAPVPTRTGAVPFADRSASAPPARTHRQPVVEGHQSERVDMEGSEPVVALEPPLRQEGAHLSRLQPAHRGIRDLELIEQLKYGLPVHASLSALPALTAEGTSFFRPRPLHGPSSSRTLRLLPRVNPDLGEPGCIRSRHVYAQHAAHKARLDVLGLHIAGNSDLALEAAHGHLPAQESVFPAAAFLRA